MHSVFLVLLSLDGSYVTLTSNLMCSYWVVSFEVLGVTQEFPHLWSWTNELTCWQLCDVFGAARASRCSDGWDLGGGCCPHYEKTQSSQPETWHNWKFCWLGADMRDLWKDDEVGPFAGGDCGVWRQLP